MIAIKNRFFKRHGRPLTIKRTNEKTYNEATGKFEKIYLDYKGQYISLQLKKDNFIYEEFEYVIGDFLVLVDFVNIKEIKNDDLIIINGVENKIRAIVSLNNIEGNLISKLILSPTE